MDNTPILWVVGERAETVDTSIATGGISHVNFGRVERVTQKYVFVRNQYGAVQKHHQDSGKTVGYDGLFLSSRVIPLRIALQEVRAYPVVGATDRQRHRRNLIEGEYAYGS